MRHILATLSLLLVISCGGDSDSAASHNQNDNSAPPQLSPDLNLSVMLASKNTQTLIIEWSEKGLATKWDAVSLCEESNTEANSCKLIKKAAAEQNMLRVSLAKDNLGIEQLLAGNLFLLFHKNNHISAPLPLTIPKEIAEKTVQYFKPTPVSSITDIRDGQFGEAMAIDEQASIMAVGATLENSGANLSGAVYIFAQDKATGAWRQTATLKAKTPIAEGRFGRFVSLSDDGLTLAVAHPGDNAIDVFTRKKLAGTAKEDWSRESLRFTEEGKLGLFAMSMSDDGLVIAATAQTDSGRKVPVFKRNSGVWARVATLARSEPSFGSTIEIDHDGANIAINDTEGTGKVIIYSGSDYSAGNPIIPPINTAKFFGLGMSFSKNNLLAIGSYGKNAWLFEKSGSDWVVRNQLDVPSEFTALYSGFGATIALSPSGEHIALSLRGSPEMPGINGEIQGDKPTSTNGAVFVYPVPATSEKIITPSLRLQNLIIKSSAFGRVVEFSKNAGVLAISANIEQSRATGINGDESDIDEGSSTTYGAVWVYKLGTTP